MSQDEQVPIVELRLASVLGSDVGRVSTELLKRLDRIGEALEAQNLLREKALAVEIARFNHMVQHDSEVSAHLENQRKMLSRAVPPREPWQGEEGSPS